MRNRITGFKAVRIFYRFASESSKEGMHSINDNNKGREYVIHL